jgi:hypothetical protein
MGSTGSIRQSLLRPAARLRSIIASPVALIPAASLTIARRPFPLPSRLLPNRSLPNRLLPNRSLPNRSLPGRLLPNRPLPNRSLPNRSLPGRLLSSRSRSDLSLPRLSRSGLWPYSFGFESTLARTGLLLSAGLRSMTGEAVARWWPVTITRRSGDLLPSLLSCDVSVPSGNLLGWGRR